MQVPLPLINKYNQAVPRYTSYPPANFFKEISSDTYTQMLIDSNKDDPYNISLYFHIPFCTQLCYFCGCNTEKEKAKEETRLYIDALKQEMQLTAALLHKNRKISQVHWGGGTPNSIAVEMIAEIMTLSQQLFSFTPTAEIAIECHPALLTKDYILALADLGFNRISLGIQDFNPKVLAGINRAEPSMPMADMMHIIRAFPHIKVNFDFVYGLPHQNKERFTQTINEAIALTPDRLVTFSYAHVPWLNKAQKILDKQGLPSAQLKLELFELAYNKLQKAGYKAIGLDHFAKPQDELYIALEEKKLHRNFQGYCTKSNTGQVYAFGTTGITQLTSGYAQNTKDIKQYIANITQNTFGVVKGYKLNKQELTIRQAINAIMCNGYLSWSQLALETQQDVSELQQLLNFNRENFNTFAKEGMLKLTDDSIKLTAMGRFFVRIIAAELDPVFAATHQKFSKAL